MNEGVPNLSGLHGRQLVLGCCAGLLVLSFYRSAKGEAQGSLYKRLWGTSTLAIMLSVAADFAPTVAGPFAVLVLLGSFTNGGDRAIQQALDGLAKTSPATKPATKTTK